MWFFLETNELEQIISKIKKKEVLKKGDLVYGNVVQTTPKVAIIDIKTNNKNKVLSPTDTGILFINDISNSYIDKVSDLVKKNDIIKAKIIDQDKFGFKLTINEPDLGVVRAICYKCKEPLDLNTKIIKCIKCKTEQNRKIGKMW